MKYTITFHSITTLKRNLRCLHLHLCLLTMVILASLSLSSCTEEGTDVDDINKQTILVFMPWTDQASLQAVFEQNIDSMKTAISKEKGMANSRLMVFMSSSSDNARLFEITWAKNTGCVEKTVKEYNDAPQQSAEGIAEVIGDAQKSAPALNYALIIGGHGTGWTYKDLWTNYPYKVKRSFGSVSDKANAIDIETLAEAIAATGTTMQYILFDNCYMANIEVAYALKDVTNFLVASTSEINLIGMPYKSMWSSLCSATPSYSGMTQAYKTFYSKYKIPCGSLSAIDCRKLTELAAVMKEINSRYSLADSLRDSIQTTDGFNQHIFYDMTDYVEHLAPSRALMNRYNTAIKAAIRSNAYTETFYSYIYSKALTIDVKTHCGVTISDPSINSVALNGREKTSWWKATH